MWNVKIVNWLSVQSVDDDLYTPVDENILSIQSAPTSSTCEPAFLQLYWCNMYRNAGSQV
jgi:hypothetical protein